MSMYKQHNNFYCKKSSIYFDVFSGFTIVSVKKMLYNRYSASII